MSIGSFCFGLSDSGKQASRTCQKHVGTQTVKYELREISVTWYLGLDPVEQPTQGKRRILKYESIWIHL